MEYSSEPSLPSSRQYHPTQTPPRQQQSPSVSATWFERAVCADNDVVLEMYDALKGLETAMAATERKRTQELNEMKEHVRRLERENEVMNLERESDSVALEELTKKNEESTMKIEELRREKEARKVELKELERESKANKTALEKASRASAEEISRLRKANETLREENDERKREFGMLKKRTEEELKKMNSTLTRLLASTRIADEDGVSLDSEYSMRKSHKATQPETSNEERAVHPPPSTEDSSAEFMARIRCNSAASMTIDARTNAFIDFLLQEFEYRSGSSVSHSSEAKQKFRNYAMRTEPSLLKGSKQTVRRVELAFWDGRDLRWSLSGMALDRYTQRRENFWKGI
ncbi:hypothetical protein BFW01_g4274 [Lasiodiplodia theobromae]|uniref:Stress response protein NST1 n=1 Tax=Lasiodiplodia theobromae TaxID=45133 RepID=A0A5N5D8G7_9PEZI|nr:Myb-like protein x-like [Lasiodiplodia theobromae]KAB2573941.1 Stress response protein NST1 [Lasiodiplodia theobromae]KAF4538296.1 Myb-like protein x-like [Lasiodiplodia theobromae]KAF9633380.1 hypothetical protein BFW01_g4274 [Lasiodiplodia theobromae]